jgi:hypothetical protein
MRYGISKDKQVYKFKDEQHRDKKKTMRSLKKTDTPILKGSQICHNYIREHQALKVKT